MAALDTDVKYIKGVGEKRAKAFERLGIKTLWDLISFFPRTYEDRREIFGVSGAVFGESMCVRGMVADAPHSRRISGGLSLIKFTIVDERSSMQVAFFNQNYVQEAIQQGETYIFYGKIAGTPGRPELINPLFEPEARAGTVTSRIIPVYRLTAGISQKIMMNAVFQGLTACRDQLTDPIPPAVRQSHQLSHASFAYDNIHFPPDLPHLELAKRRLIFEELFVLSCATALLKARRISEPGLPMHKADLSPFLRVLPYTLTAAQTQAIREVAADLSSDTPMNRLIQGDVGSGKTVVAAACAYYAFCSGFQTAFMAPTEILARQHYDTLQPLLAPLGIKTGLLTGSMSAKQKRTVISLLENGELDMVIGTHALLSDTVSFSRLGLVVTDEQHRFGVLQRSALAAKGLHPHILVMSATPIPRTLALIIYGDLDISIINELPPGRQKVDTFAVDESKRQRVTNFIRKLVSEGRQVYVVCPAVSESETLDVKSAEAHAKELETVVFPELSVALIHGKMKSKEKESVMSAFSEGKHDILVATTVIEVGVDVPNAALMVIENAERFGLSQLHQLRGRVGRGKHKSYCILFSSFKGEENRARLNALSETNDGFQIAEEDLKLRGPGDFFGARQHGLPEMKIASFQYDMQILKEAQKAAQALLADDRDLTKPEHAALINRIRTLFALDGEIFN